ncbi:unnamed protein product [Amoebophrya sp. A25]|nr:unnamed protein product [Amoebophrya sp. A25]|eukprot:GSA25T00027739001.1
MIRDFCTRRLIKPIWHSTKLNKSNGLTKVTTDADFFDFLRLNQVIEILVSLLVFPIFQALGQS